MKISLNRWRQSYKTQPTQELSRRLGNGCNVGVGCWLAIGTFERNDRTLPQDKSYAR